ncbi:protein kinase domain-containing protein [Acinetobacter pseudolwoffii]|uniref:protein kinase domain-containing protein n=1 Tax=Acinetobacter pseudolwoffii TaxID=2053287 RepID=UPI0012FDB965|nr:protein kinase [Acinetobacter pseudolwoffii]
MSLNQFIETSQYGKEIEKLFIEKQELEFLSCNQDGANGEIILARNRHLNREVAIKIYDHEKDTITHEPTLVARINHENIVKVHDAGLLSSSPYATSYYVMERAQESLTSYLSNVRISTQMALKLFKDLLKGLSCLHSKEYNLIHRDLKPDNLLVESDTLKIGDFGSVKKLNTSNKSFVSKHSILYRPPESFGSQGFFDRKSDIYQAGIILAVLLGYSLSDDLESYLSSRDRKTFDTLTKYEDQAIFLDRVIESRITTQKLIDYSKLPFYVDSKLISIVRKMVCSYDKRFNSIVHVLTALTDYERSKKNWVEDENGNFVLENFKGKDYLIVLEKGGYLLKHRRNSQNFIQIPRTDVYESLEAAYKELNRVISK